ncbi:MAG: glycosyl hydrolase 53 family protein [Paludibacteraceae bacterium]|nr:glycosyl hydrolase 53 family protein [Paludibacteraceae bacterium]
MRKKILLFLLALLSCPVGAQTVTFTGQEDEDGQLRLNRVVVSNRTQGWQGIVFGPDTLLTLQNMTEVDYLGNDDGISLSPNNPNPFMATTEVCLTIAEDGEVTLLAADMSGQMEAVHTTCLEAGTHKFQVSLATKGLHVLAAHKGAAKTSIVMMCNGGGSANAIDYLRILSQETPEQHDLLNAGDMMEYVGYADMDGVEVKSQSVTQMFGASKAVTLQFAKEAKKTALSPSDKPNNDFRVALSLSPFSLKQFRRGYTFSVGDRLATTPEELQQIYHDLGSTEMYVRIATKRDTTAEDITDGKKDENANVHTFTQAMELCRIAKKVGMPINPEIMCAYTYMDMDGLQAPRFEEYPEIYALQNGKQWSELSLNEICTVLEAYGELVADSILSIGCTVHNWNLGNEANFGFAGIGMGAKTAVDPKLAKATSMQRYMASVFSVWWLKKHVWCYEAKAFAAVRKGVLKAYAKHPEHDASKVKFSTHIATVVFTPRCSASFFLCMRKNGYAMETAGISYYPSAPSMTLNRAKLLTKTVTRINRKCKIPVFVGEFAYPSGSMSGPFSGWNKTLGRYAKNQQGQADVYADLVAWGKTHGMAGIRYWAPDYEGWSAMAMFTFSDKKGTSKIILNNHKEIVSK